MVKKTSLFGKIKNRLRTSSVGVDTGDARQSAQAETSRSTTPRAETNRVDAVARRQEQVSGRKMSGKEEAVVAIQDGFKELSSLLRGVQSRVDTQGERLANSTEALSQLPALNQSQIELMRMLAQRMEKQDQANEVMIQSFGELPDVMKDLRSALDRAAATDERTADTLGEFQDNMSRIQSAMSEMVDSSKEQASASKAQAAASQEQATAAAKQAHAAAKLADGAGSHSEALADAVSSEQRVQTDAVKEMVNRLDKNQNQGLKQLSKTTGDNLKQLRSVQADQADRLGKIVEDGTKTNRAIVILLGLVFVALCVVGAILVTG